ncbi:MAG TPA: methyl-accepting chemotaxis protein [Sulfuricurvum sp.]|nr:methyl-accepting chemotaxis protein [Sulfuricurvum sp.]
MSTIKGKLLLLIAAMSFIVIIIASYGALGMKGCNNSFKDVYDNRIVPLNQLKAVADMYAVNIVDTCHKARNGNLTPKEAIANIKQAQSTIAKEWGAYTSTALTPEEEKLVGKAKEEFVQADKGVEKLLSLLEANDLQGVASFSIHELYPKIDPISDTVGKLVSLQLEESKVGYDLSEKNYDSRVNIMILIVLGGLGAGLFLALYIIRSISNSTTGFSRTMSTISKNQDLTQVIHHDNEDELKLIAVGFNELIGSVQKALNEAKHSASENSAVAEELFATSSKIGIRSEETARAMDDALRVSDEVSAILKNGEEQSKTTGKMMQGASVKVGEIAGNVLEVSGALQQVVEEQVELAQRLEHLSQEAEQIKQILSVISDIADQTNLLALNAAIEAARAGEHGRGFAVVADEVRKLAERTQKSLSESNSTVSIIVQSVNDATEMMSRSAAEIKRLGEHVQQVEVVMHETVDEITQAAKSAAISASGAGEGVLKTNNIIEQMRNITKLASTNARSVEEIAAAVEHLAKLSEGLNTTLSTFKTA